MTRCILLLIMVLFAHSVPGADTTTLAAMLSAVQRDPNVSQDSLPLQRDWIGDIRDDHGKIERLRLEKGRIIKGRISLLRVGPYGGYRGSDAPDYLQNVPTNEKLRECTTVEQLGKLLGAGRPSFDGWGGPDVIHSSHSWVCFGPAASVADRLTYISVFVHTSWTSEQHSKGLVQVNGIEIRRGELRLADPDNREESRLYLPGADMFAAEEKEKAIARQRYPRPLRDLLEVRERPDDPNLDHLSIAIQAIREAPDPKLFQQLVQELHEGTLKIRSLLEYILLNEHGLLKLRPWDKSKERTAVNACIEALPSTKEPTRLVEILLRVCGGGKIEIKGEHGGTSVKVARTADGYMLTLGSAERPLALKDTQKELRRLYASSNAEP